MIVSKEGKNPRPIADLATFKVDEEGKYVTSALEYETLWAMGAMTGIDDLDSASSQIRMAALDSMGLCMFAQSGGMENLLRAGAAVTGKQFGSQEWQQLGRCCLTAEIDFNHRAGLTKEHDRLPDMFHEEPLPPYHEAIPYPDKDLQGTFLRLLENKK